MLVFVVLVLFAFLHYCNDPSQITVYGTYSSILESGNLFDKVILPSGVKHKIKVSSRRDFDDCPDEWITELKQKQASLISMEARYDEFDLMLHILCNLP